MLKRLVYFLFGRPDPLKANYIDIHNKIERGEANDMELLAMMDGLIITGYVMSAYQFEPDAINKIAIELRRVHGQITGRLEGDGYVKDKGS
jgi:hypothetical protein